MKNNENKNLINVKVKKLIDYLVELEIIDEEIIPRGENETEIFKNFIILNYLKIFEDLKMIGFRTQNQLRDFTERGNSYEYLIDRIHKNLGRFYDKKKIIEDLITPHQKNLMNEAIRIGDAAGESCFENMKKNFKVEQV